MEFIHRVGVSFCDVINGVARRSGDGVDWRQTDVLGKTMGSRALIRSRWAAIGAAIAVTLGGGGLIGVSAASGDASSLRTLTPTRILDTREGSEGKISDKTIALQVTGAASVVPAGAGSVSVNLTVTGGERNGDYGFVTAFPCTAASDAVPNASTLNFVEGVDVANSTVVPLGATGMMCLYVYGSAHLIVDANGYYETSSIDEINASIDEINSDLEEVEDALEGVAWGANRNVTYSHSDWRIANQVGADAPCRDASNFTQYATTTAFLTNEDELLDGGADHKCDFEISLTPPVQINGYTWALRGVTTCLSGLTGLGDPHHIEEMLLEYATYTAGEGYLQTLGYETDEMVPQIIVLIPTGFDVSDADVPEDTNCGFWQTEHMPQFVDLDVEDSDFVEQQNAAGYSLSIRLSEGVDGTSGLIQQTLFHDVVASWYAVADA